MLVCAKNKIFNYIQKNLILQIYKYLFGTVQTHTQISIYELTGFE